jgi:hypothetical protein
MVEEAIAISLVGTAFILFWVSSQEHMRRKHEALSLLFFFLGIVMVFVNMLASATIARSGGFYGVEGIFITLLQIMVWVFVFVLFYFLLTLLIYAFKRFLSGKGGGGDGWAG